jgi:hypothetical protein
MSTDQRPEPLRLGSIAPNFDAETTVSCALLLQLDVNEG